MMKSKDAGPQGAELSEIFLTVILKPKVTMKVAQPMEMRQVNFLHKND